MGPEMYNRIHDDRCENGKCVIIETVFLSVESWVCREHARRRERCAKSKKGRDFVTA